MGSPRTAFHILRLWPLGCRSISTPSVHQQASPFQLCRRGHLVQLASHSAILHGNRAATCQDVVEHRRRCCDRAVVPRLDVAGTAILAVPRPDRSRRSLARCISQSGRNDQQHDPGGTSQPDDRGLWPVSVQFWWSVKARHTGNVLRRRP